MALPSGEATKPPTVTKEAFQPRSRQRGPGRPHTCSPEHAHARPAVLGVIPSTPTPLIPELRRGGKWAGLQASWGEGDPSRPCRPFSQVPAISTLPRGLDVSGASGGAGAQARELPSAAAAGGQPRPHGPASSWMPLPLPALQRAPEPGDPQPCFSRRTPGGWPPTHVHGEGTGRKEEKPPTPRR